MIELLSTLTFTQIFIYVVLILIAAKELLTLKDFFKNRVDKQYEIENSDKKQIETILAEIKSLKEEIQAQKQEYNVLKSDIYDFKQHYENKEGEHKETLKLLIESDRDAIKSFIVKEYHHFIDQQWIDDFSLDTIEKRFDHYKEEGGNSYICNLMKDLRDLPNNPPRK